MASLPDGWVLAHAQEPKAVKASGTGADVITVKDGHYVAFKRVGTTLYEQSGSDMDELVQRINDWEASQPGVPNPLTEDGNRVLSADEKLESAKATTLMQVTEGARVSRMADLTEKSTTEKPKAAIVHARAEPTVEKLSGDQAASIVAAPEAAATVTPTPANAPKSSGKSGSKK